MRLIHLTLIFVMQSYLFITISKHATYQVLNPYSPDRREPGQDITLKAILSAEFSNGKSWDSMGPILTVFSFFLLYFISAPTCQMEGSLKVPIISKSRGRRKKRSENKKEEEEE